MRIPAILLSLLLALSGCEERPIYKPEEVSIAIAMPCAAKMPKHNTWPTKTVQPDADILAQTRAALSEIELRKGYEAQLRAALQSCL